ncbi:MAG: TIGR01459 family HAD-type hydrolase [Pseudomonadota bacterium]
MRIIDGISEIAGGYEAMLCDAWGVIHNGRRVFEGVAEAMATFRKERGPVLILTNAPRPAEIIPAQLDRLGLPRECWDAIVTSGDATMFEFNRRAPGPAFRLGPEKDDPMFAVGGLRFAPMEEAAFIACTGLFHDETEEPEAYRDLLKEGADRGIPMVCANPDIIVDFGGKRMWCAGALAAIYEELGGSVVHVGKPHPPIYGLAYEKMRAVAGRDIPREKILVIGDGLATDIAGANAQGLDVVFVASGIHGEDARGEDGALDGAKLEVVLSVSGRTAVAAMEGLRW